jgi:hypothetical protein
LLARLLALRAPAWIGTTGGYRGAPPSAGLRCALSIAGSELDFKVVDLIPLGVGSLAFRYSKKLLQAITGKSRLRCIHVGIISSFDTGGRARPAYECDHNDFAAEHMGALAIFPRVKDPQDEYIVVRQLVAQFVISNQDTTNFARVEL